MSIRIADEIAGIVRNAKSLSRESSTAAATEQTRRSIEMISMVAEKLLAQKPPIEPSYDNVVERGKIIFGDFPARQTLKNSYRSIIGEWRNAYGQIIQILSRDIMSSAISGKRLPETGSDSGMTIAILKQKVIRLQAELDGHKRATSTLTSLGRMKASSDDPAPQELQIMDVAPIRKWLSNLNDKDTLLVEDDSGLRLSPSCRPGRLLLDRKVLASLRSL